MSTSKKDYEAIAKELNWEYREMMNKLHEALDNFFDPDITITIDKNNCITDATGHTDKGKLIVSITPLVGYDYEEKERIFFKHGLCIEVIDKVYHE